MKTKPTVITYRTGNERYLPAAVTDFIPLKNNFLGRIYKLIRGYNFYLKAVFTDIHWLVFFCVHFLSWSHANNTTRWGTFVTLHTLPTWLLVTSVRALILMTWTHHQNSKKLHSTHSKNTAKWEPHSTGMTADRPGESVTVAALLSFFLHSPVQQDEEEVGEDHVRPKSRGFHFFIFSRPRGLKCFKAKAHTGLTQDKEQQLWGSPFQTQQERECVGFSLHTELTFYIYWSFILVLNKHVRQTWEMQYNSWHLEYTDA